MHRPVRWLAASLGLVLLAGALPSRLAAQTGTITCSSDNNARKECSISPGTEVTLTRQLSTAPCREGTNWGRSERYIWVTGGCRAEFSVTAAVPGNANATATPTQLRACRSEAARRLGSRAEEDIEVRPESRQGSVAQIQWRSDTKGKLCTVAATGRIVRFTEETVAPERAPLFGRNTRTLTCESRGMERHECPIEDGAQVRLTRQLSDSPCRVNDTYGIGKGYVWVAKGCRAEFEVSTRTTRADVPRERGEGNETNDLAPRRITCQSVGNVQRQCPIPLGATVRMVRQISPAGCKENQSWGVGTTYIWVNRGCAAEFEVTPRTSSAAPSGATTRIVCQSNGNERQRCRVAGAESARLIAQYSSSPCTEGKTFGTGYDHLWVSDGCRGEFEVTVAGVSGGKGPAQRVTCESESGKRKECAIPAGSLVRIAKQLSGTTCIQGTNWGTTRDAIWVWNGCRAEFEVR